MKNTLFFLHLCLVVYVNSVEAVPQPTAMSPNRPVNDSSTMHPLKHPTNESPLETIDFSFEKKKLTTIVEEIAERKNISLIFPTGVALAALNKQLITYHPHGKSEISLDKAWHLLMTFMELSGFSLLAKNDSMYTIIDKKAIEGGTIPREVLPLYVETPAENLPSSQEPIRYIYYISSMKVPQPAEREAHPLNSMLKQFLSPGASVLFEPSSNGIIMTDRAPHIASIIKILKEFDSRGFEEQLDYVPLQYVSAQKVVQIFDTLRKASGEQPPPPGPQNRTGSVSSPSYFAQDTRIIAHESNNAVIIMGKENTVGRISDFIKGSIDAPPESGKSILHYYDLQYLDAQAFAPQLQRAVSTVLEGGTQATQIPTRDGSERYLQGVQVLAEGYIEIQKPATTEKIQIEQKGGMEIMGVEGVQKIGGNRLIIAARQDDWEIVKSLIKKLDIKRRQVLLEVYIIDFTYEQQNIVASDLRNRTDNCSNSGVQFLASHISPPANVLGTNPTQLAQDLLQITGPTELGRRLNRGSLLISLNDPLTPGIFGLLQILQRSINVKIQSHPYLIITDQQTGSIESEEIRFLQGDLVTTANGTFTIPLENVSATLKVVVTPHIASEDRVRLDIGFTADEFVSTNSNTRLTRGLKTTATLASGQILAMGGLLRNDTLSRETFTPLLGKVPLAGVFFRGENKDETITNIVLLASPTIIEPRKTDIIKNEKTREKVAEVILHENVHQQTRDPLYNLFFQEPENHMVRSYFQESTNLQDIGLSPHDKPIKLIATKKPLQKQEETFKIDTLKELLAFEDLPPVRKKNSFRKV
ncbi:hypothetical protein H0X06_00725 [Candidatus Dependentiae bacterium]|nr:hypothetical protein [Candidatus Dependentiae bacterium]